MDYMLLQGGGKVGRGEMIVTPDGPKWTAWSYVKVRGLGVREVVLFAIIFPPPRRVEGDWWATMLRWVGESMKKLEIEGGGKPDERELVDFDDFVGEECGGARADTSNGIQRNRCLTCHHSYECAFSIGFCKRGYQYLPRGAE